MNIEQPFGIRDKTYIRTTTVGDGFSIGISTDDTSFAVFLTKEEAAKLARQILDTLENTND